MTLADCRRPPFACRMIYRSSPAVVVLGRPPPTFQTAVPVVWNAFQARETTLLLIPNSEATLVTVRPSSSFPIILLRVKSSRVPVELQHSSDLPKLENDLKRLEKSDPMIQYITENTDIVDDSEEPHVENWLNDVKEDKTCIPLKKTNPVVVVPESVPKESKDVPMRKIAEEL
ncbi:structural maintenance of chromosomes protein 2-2 [Trichonephila clavipes]|nr:structural maintenance of chromosomes protein 2-2 [Trichonephila clavipes]